MLFNSYAFLFAFLPLTLTGWWLLRRPEHRVAFLAAASVFFYAWWDVRYVPLLLLIAAADHFGGRAIGRARDDRTRKRALWAALSVNVAALVTYKLLGFVFSSVNGIGELVGAGQPVPELELALPLGIGFFTLNGISYLVDVYRRIVEPAPSVAHFTAFLALFPHLIAGPIVRYPDLRPQLSAPPRRLTAELASRGLTLLALGLAKKLLVADALAPHVDSYWGSPETLTLTSGWAAAVGYTMQLYFDFSAYSDMAVGLALLLGIRFPRNFDAPFRSRNLAEFWRRWHITLGAWARDYLYLPLGGSRRSLARTALNLVVVFTLIGLWHGAAWTFVVFGLAHGVVLAGRAVLTARGVPMGGVAIGRAATFGFFVVTLAIFRSPDMGTAIEVLSAMAGLNGIRGGADVTVGFALVLAALVAATQIGFDPWDIAFRRRLSPALAVACGVLGAAALLELTDPSPFLYFRF
jgi:alginate O-acetyltransferase complex protein AlgI